MVSERRELKSRRWAVGREDGTSLLDDKTTQTMRHEDDWTCLVHAVPERLQVAKQSASVASDTRHRIAPVHVTIVPE